MREILFKAKTIGGDYWVYGDYRRMVIGGNIKHYLQSLDSEPIQVIAETVCQYTGLNDKNNNKIFDGDIIKTHHGSLIDIIDMEFLFLFRYENNYAFPRIEIIGNIHDKK